MALAIQAGRGAAVLQLTNKHCKEEVVTHESYGVQGLLCVCVVSWGWGGAVRITIKSTRLSSPDDMGLNPHCGPPAVLGAQQVIAMNSRNGNRTLDIYNMLFLVTSGCNGFQYTFVSVCAAL
eukprot:jgi/Chrzof1/12799/Cz07g07290.t1